MPESTPQPLNGPLYRRLTESQLQQIHEASLEILSSVGVRFYDEEGVELFRKAGATIDDGNRVHLDQSRVDWALDVVPKEVTLHSTDGEPAIRLYGRTAWFGNGSDLLNIIDHRTGERRKAVLQDVRDIIQVVDSLPGIDFVMSGFLPSDLPREQAELRQMRVMLEGTRKPMVFVTTDMEKARKETEMLELVAGGTRALREKPTAACYINIATPLRHNEESVQKLLYFAEKGLPIIYRPSLVMRGMTTPITVPGFLALNNSSQLAGVVLSQLKNEGAPFIRCGCAGGTFDMGTSVGLLSAPEVRGFNEDLAHFYRLPCFGIGGTTDSKAVDAQAAMEAALTLLTSTQAGAQLIHDVGYMESGATGSLEQLVIAHEMIGWVKAYMKTPEINDETLALDVIAEVGPDGAFIETEHTLNHFREDHYPELSDRKRFHRWFEDGGSTMKERARVQLERILSEKPQQKLPTDISSRIEEMI